ncbi:probable cytochrome P450 6a14 [Topomyia yanbarensis]|uniref:probable cytochrome P450 6a14 n=1 Tax=Topomyia yanbarensis TaxID=2498891 RepID=UPI00273B710B|nr:probable cytochrome P450 6a14 [Topomyia yanbarensis]
MGLLSTLLYLVLPALLLLYLYVRRKFLYWADRNFPYVAGSFPMGSFNGMGTKYHFTEIMDQAYQKFKMTGLSSAATGMYLGFKPCLLVYDLDLIKQILVKDFNNFRDRGMYFNEKDDPLSAHLFSIEGDKWRFLRNKLSPTFTSGKMKYMFLTIKDIGDEFLHCFDKYIESKQPADVKTLAQRFTCDVIGSCAFGLECNSLKNEGSELMVIGDKVFKPGPLRTMLVFFLISFRDLSTKLGLKQIPSDVTKYFMDVVQNTVGHREKNNVIRQDFLQLLMQLKNKGTVEEHEEESKETISMNDVAAQAFLFFFAGFETSSTALSFALFELAANLNVQDKLRDEIKLVLAANGGQITYEALKEMTYMEQVINETLRIHPPLGNLIRIANEPYRLTSPNVTIEKGQMVMIPVYSIHHDPTIYEDPERFDPERFAPEAVRIRHSHCFLPFGDGPRNCIGMRFAMLEVKFGLAQLISQLRFTINERTKLPLEIDVKSSLLEVKGGLWLDVSRV